MCYSYLAQLAEHLTVNQVVAGSSPAVGAKKKDLKRGLFFLDHQRREPIFFKDMIPPSVPPPSNSRSVSLEHSLRELLSLGGFTR